MKSPILRSRPILCSMAKRMRKKLRLSLAENQNICLLQGNTDDIWVA